MPHALSLMQAVISSNYIAYSASRLALPYLASNDVKTLLPKGTPKALTYNHFDVYLYWSKHLSNNQANVWLRQLIQEIFVL